MAHPFAIMTETRSLDEVVGAILRLGDRPHPAIYVERRGAAYRWSITHGGGPYPLLREVCRYLGIPHQGLVLPFTTVDGVAIVRPAPGVDVPIAAAGFIQPSADPAALRERILAVCGAP